MEIIEPLFPCYLFANFDKDKYLHMFTYTKGVRYIIGKSNLIIVYGEIINTIKENIKDNDIITLNPQSFKKGDRVFIKEGPFKDFYGIFERETKSFDRVVILLDIICYKVELDSCFLTKCTL
jgi:transcriptional antiterminator RfaH